MPRPKTLPDDDLVVAITRAFQQAGYDGASLSRLSEATGLKRASLYHRFPGGKEQMAEEALAGTLRLMEEKVLSILRGLGTPRQRLEAARDNLVVLYDKGAVASLINLFGTPDAVPPSLLKGVQALLSAFISALSRVLEEAGLPGDEARARALKGVVQLEGALVLARAFRDSAPFNAVIGTWAEDLLRGAEPSAPARPKPTSKELPQVRRAVAAHLLAQKDRQA